MSKELARILSPLRGQTESYIKNSKHFVEKLNDISLEEFDKMVSFDVKSLFAKVPIDECLDIVEEKLREDDTLGERTMMSPQTISSLIKLCMTSTYFGFENDIYEQKEGAPMGSPLSPILADILLGNSLTTELYLQGLKYRLSIILHTHLSNLISQSTCLYDLYMVMPQGGSCFVCELGCLEKEAVCCLLPLKYQLEGS